jgi:hypothetical protein
MHIQYPADKQIAHLLDAAYHHRNQTQSHTQRAENKAQGGKQDHRPRRGANVVYSTNLKK